MPEPPRDPRVITAERIGDVRTELRELVVDECGQLTDRLAAGIDKALRDMLRIGEHHAHLKRTQPGTPPDRDRVRTPMAPDPGDRPTQRRRPTRRR